VAFAKNGKDQPTPKILHIFTQCKWGGGAPAGRDGGDLLRYHTLMAEQFTKHRQPWKAEEVAKLRTLAGKGKGLKEIAKALNRSEESTKERAKIDGIGIAKLR
jgi:hypothetical protein